MTDINSEVEYGAAVEVLTFSGWEPFDWNMYDTSEEAFNALYECACWRIVEQQT